MRRTPPPTVWSSCATTRRPEATVPPNRSGLPLPRAAPEAAHRHCRNLADQWFAHGELTLGQHNHKRVPTPDRKGTSHMKVLRVLINDRPASARGVRTTTAALSRRAAVARMSTAAPAKRTAHGAVPSIRKCGRQPDHNKSTAAVPRRRRPARTAIQTVSGWLLPTASATASARREPFGHLRTSQYRQVSAIGA